MGDCFGWPRPVSASATEVIATSLLASAALAAVRRRFSDFSGGVGLVWARPAWSRARKGFLHWPNNFDFLCISEVGLVLENKAKVRWSFVITGKFAAKWALCKKENADFSCGAAETRRGSGFPIPNPFAGLGTGDLGLGTWDWGLGAGGWGLGTGDWGPEFPSPLVGEGQGEGVFSPLARRERARVRAVRSSLLPSSLVRWGRRGISTPARRRLLRESVSYPAGGVVTPRCREALFLHPRPAETGCRTKLTPADATSCPSSRPPAGRMSRTASTSR